MERAKEIQEAELNECPLPDDYIVYPNYIYVCDGKVIRSNIDGNVTQLKAYLRRNNLKAEVICSCDIVGRIKAIKAEEEKRE